MLIENAVDSLKFGKEFYRRYFELGDNKYNSDTIPGYLKMVVLSFQHCIELFNKKMLMEIDPKLIINKESQADYDKAKESCNERNIKFNIESFILSESFNFKTIDYTQTIKRVDDHFNLDKEEKRILMDLGNLRNRLAHFGLDVTLDFYRVLITINETIRLILENYYGKLKKSSRQIEYYYKDEFEDLLALLEEGERIENEAWAVSYSDNFMVINYTFSSLLSDKTFQQEIGELGFYIDVELGEYSDSDTLKIKISGEEGTLLKELHTINIPRMDVTLLKEVGHNDIILLVINHHSLLLEASVDCFKYYNFRGFNKPLNIKTSFWEYHATRKQGRCEKVKFSEETLQEQMKNYLNKRIKR